MQITEEILANQCTQQSSGASPVKISMIVDMVKSDKGAKLPSQRHKICYC